MEEVSPLSSIKFNSIQKNTDYIFVSRISLLDGQVQRGLSILTVESILYEALVNNRKLGTLVLEQYL